MKINFKECNKFINQLENQGYLVYESCAYKLIDGVWCQVGKIDFINKCVGNYYIKKGN